MLLHSYFLVLCALWAGDGALAVRVRDAKTRWFVLHAVANCAVCALTAPAFLYAYRHPDWAVYRPLHAPALDEWNAVLIGMLHVYHALAYRLDADDAFHHALFVPFNQAAVFAPTVLGWQAHRWGACVNMQHFFSCGLPGALDYAALALRRAGRLSRRRQKWLQAKLNLWVRGPGILFTAAFLLLETLRAAPTLPASAYAIALLDVVLIGSNSVYYTDRVVCAYARATSPSSESESAGA